MNYDLKLIYARLDTLPSKQKKLEYLEERLFQYEEAIASFIGFKTDELKFLIKITASDYQIYRTFLMNIEGTNRLPPYWGTRYDQMHADRIGIKELKPLLKRMRMVGEYNEKHAMIRIFKALIRRVKNTEENKLMEEQPGDSPQLTISEIALRQYFICTYENGPSINKLNARDFFHGTTHKTTGNLVREYKRFKKDTERIYGYHSNSGRGDTKQLRNQIERFEHIIPSLKIAYPQAALEAEKELNILMKQ